MSKNKITFEINDTEKNCIKETRVYNDGVYSHSVNVLVWPKEIIKEIDKINAGKSISKKS